MKTPLPPQRLPTKHGKKSGSVLTSTENLRIINIKEDEKKEQERLKAERQRIREEKKLLKYAKAKKSHGGEYNVACTIVIKVFIVNTAKLNKTGKLSASALIRQLASVNTQHQNVSGLIDSEFCLYYFFMSSVDRDSSPFSEEEKPIPGQGIIMCKH